MTATTIEPEYYTPEGPYTVQTRDGNRDCGHRHRTAATAARCRRRLQYVPGDPNACMARWHRAAIVGRDGASLGRLADWEAQGEAV